MLVIPAIDLKDGEAVRLYKGNYDKKTVYSSHPENLAVEFERKGAKYLHVVDLDGAKKGNCTNFDTIKKIKSKISIPIEIGGGIRSEEAIRMYLEEIGVQRVILGTIALKDPKFVKEMVEKYGDERIVVGVDVRNGYVSIEGWTENSTIKYIDFIKRLEKCKVKYIIATDITKDGTLNGPNFDMYDKIQKNCNVNIIVSGGVKDNKDVYDASKLNVYGCIVGKAYYEKRINLVEVIKCLEKE